MLLPLQTWSGTPLLVMVVKKSLARVSTCSGFQSSEMFCENWRMQASTCVVYAWSHMLVMSLDVCIVLARSCNVMSK